MTLIEEVREANSVKERASRARYRDVLMRNAQPDAGDSKALTLLMRELDISPCQLERDLAILEEAARLERRAEKEPELAEAADAAGLNLIARAEAIDVTIRELTEEKRALVVNCSSAQLKQATAATAARELRGLQRTHFALFGLDAPAVDNPAPRPAMTVTGVVREPADPALAPRRGGFGVR